ncbi:hypothetical protein PGUG_01960 [Meyerozyma guilliermondii ATCC 6260]|uniref:carnosine N-methyltransferase n=1 Tax=Meyerozyma guilliermondii (strain ATCC 6260 / CBS 566 / DSM 6381 / JCM 1539 / NBRC 10279 / NRRL Y-324) TaxID=294746 RepID=A5DFA9_PICGU|nr:uncharacterized protein PGUG_01960 [Meyerozyma guilliermondii ATCC 6260]EDK37862.2 hypothetical protein PGUG_01960 [Meyerozyma guilliermondii ATCC 6260]
MADEEWNALSGTLAAFHNFHRWSYEEVVKPRRIREASMKESEKNLLSWYSKHTSDLAEAVQLNSHFCSGLAGVAASQWGVGADPTVWAEPSGSDFDKVRSTLLQLCREWSSDGVKEREVSFGRILNEALERYPEVTHRPEVNVLVPGCGLGRLVYEFVHHGFKCQGNEFSYHMLLTSNYILNNCQFANEHSILPYIYKASHVQKRSLQLRPVTVPDVSARDIHDLQAHLPNVDISELMSMAAGSFTELYGPEEIQPVEEVQSDDAIQFRQSVQGTFDILCTCFFLDTASNIVDYLKTIRHCLKKTSGIWINFGPLLWHFEDDANVEYKSLVLKEGDEPRKVATTRKGMELSLEDLLQLMKNMGFTLDKHESGIKTTYSGDPRAMGGYVYECEYWVARVEEKTE